MADVWAWGTPESNGKALPGVLLRWARLLLAVEGGVGATWQQRPVLSLVTPCNPCGKGASPYQLAPNATKWSDLGPLPAPDIIVSASGQLWCFDPQANTLATAMLP
ncbi:MAG: hypothetical protein ACHQ4H_15220 [Ktedonobacterales bacterium]